jgi:hypothetical protein
VQTMTEAPTATHHLDSAETSHLRPDGTVFPPVTPDPPAPPGYVSPLEDSSILDSPTSS